MKENKIIYRCAIIVGVALIIAALSRAINVNNLVIAITTGDIASYHAASIMIDGSLSSMLLLLIAIWIFFLARDLRKLQKRAWSQAAVIGTALTVFGACFWYQYRSSLHLALYFLLGLILLFPLFIYRKDFKS
ncbi:MAG: hypothetical protein JST75_06395 [Bacteroidetes bacterium]|nr:hypothetical protein [Bacteroidota bacterium]